MHLRRVLLPALAGMLAAVLLPGVALGIGGGTPGAPGYVARIDVVRTATSTWTCSGALVTPRLVVTAAHCLYSARPGDWTVTVAHGTPAAEARDVVAAVPYPGSPPAEDLAVLVLDRPVAQSPVALDGVGVGVGVGAGVVPGAVTTALGAGSPVVAAGYGATSPGGNMSPVARRAGQTVDRVASRGGVTSLLLTRPAAAGGGPAPGACELGDSGGPLVSGASLVGVLSEGNSAARACWYTRLDRATPTRAWLDSIIAQYGGAPVPPASAPSSPAATPAAPTPAAPAAAVPTVPGAAAPAAGPAAGPTVPGPAATVPGAAPGVAAPTVAPVPGAVAPPDLGPLAGTAAGDIAAGATPTPTPAAVPIFTADAFGR